MLVRATSSGGVLFVSHLGKGREALQGRDWHMYLLITLSCIFSGIETLSTLVCVEHSSADTVLIPAVVPLAGVNLHLPQLSLTPSVTLLDFAMCLSDSDTTLLSVFC